MPEDQTRPGLPRTVAHSFANETVVRKHVVLNFDKPTSFEIIGIAGHISKTGFEHRDVSRVLLISAVTSVCL